MFPTSTHQGQSVMGFPDVCKTPSTAPSMPVAYPNIGGVQTAQQLRSQLSGLHNQLISMAAQDPTRWHALVDQYVLTTAQLFNTLKATTATKTPTAYKQL